MSTPRSCSWSDMLCSIVSDSRRILAAHSRHFLALSVLFLLPLSSLLAISPSLTLTLTLTLTLPSLQPHLLPVLRFSPLDPASLALPLLYTLTIPLLAACAAASITHSAHHAFFGRPVRLISTLKSLPASLFHVSLTLLAALLPFILLAPLLLISIRSFPFFLAFSILVAAVAIYFLVNWSLAVVISIIESDWGFAPLWRSADLVRGMRTAVLCLNICFATGVGVMLWGFSLGITKVAGDWSEVIPVVVRTVFCSAITALLFLYFVVMNVVLYLYCKALHGELAKEIAEEFAWEYFCLPFDEEKVPHVVSVVRR